MSRAVSPTLHDVPCATPVAVRPAGVRGAARWIGLLAFLWLHLLAGAHYHGGPRPAAVLTPTVAAHVATPGPSSPDQPDDCPICQTIAHADAYLLPDAVHLGQAAIAPFWVVPALAAGTTPRTDSHAWLSRAPPPPLLT